MPAYRYPVLVWEDHAGNYTAVPVEDLDDYADLDEEIAGFGRTEKEALRELTAFLSWLGKKNGDLPEPSVQNVQSVDFAVSIRPESRDHRRTYPCEYRIRLPFTCVYGNLSEDLLLASAPYIGLRFRYFSRDNLKTLFIHKVQAELKEMDTLNICLHLPPASSRLAEVTIKAPSTFKRSFSMEEQFETLVQVAEPMDSRQRKRRAGPAWEREKEITDLMSRLRDEKTNVLLVSESGAGKSTIIMEAARRLAGTEVNKKPKFWMSSANRLIAGMKYLGQWEERCEEVIRELEEADGLLCVDSLADLVQIGGSSPIDSVGAFFIPYLKNRELRMIAEATPGELDACRRLLPGLADQFRILRVGTMDKATALALLSRMAANARTNQKIDIQREVPEIVHHLFARFHPYAPFPGHASRFLKQLIDRAAQEKKSGLTARDAVSRFIKDAGLPDKLIDDTHPLNIEDIKASLKVEVIGQDQACRIGAEIIAAFKAGMNDPGKPVGALLFCGPTGVGKTQLAKTITNYCFGHGREKKRLIRLDMSEYTGIDATRRLTGDPATGESKMIREIRRQPFAVILFDEIEKAAPEVYDILLNILDEGRFTDIYGRITSFRSAIIVMTSNLGVESGAPIGFDQRSQGGYEKEIRAFFRPEFFNRIDEIVPFNHLGPDAIRKIAAKELADIAKREGILKRGITLAWTPALIDFLARIGYHPKYGARNLQRTIEEKAAIPLARYLLDHIHLSNVRLKMDIQGDEMVIRRA